MQNDARAGREDVVEMINATKSVSDVTLIEVAAWPNAWLIFQLGSLGLGVTIAERFFDFGNVIPPGSSAQWRVVVAFPIAGWALEVALIRQGLRRSVIAEPADGCTILHVRCKVLLEGLAGR